MTFIVFLPFTNKWSVLWQPCFWMWLQPFFLKVFFLGFYRWNWQSNLFRYTCNLFYVNVFSLGVIDFKLGLVLCYNLGIVRWYFLFSFHLQINCQCFGNPVSGCDGNPVIYTPSIPVMIIVIIDCFLKMKQWAKRF